MKITVARLKQIIKEEVDTFNEMYGTINEQGMPPMGGPPPGPPAGAPPMGAAPMGAPPMGAPPAGGGAQQAASAALQALQAGDQQAAMQILQSIAKG